MRVTTESGTVYEFTKDGSKMRRLVRRNDIDPEAPERSNLRQDGKWVGLMKPVEPEVGLPMTLLLEPLDPPLLPGSNPFATVRMTTVVVGIET